MHGDLNGIGYEIIFKAFSDNRLVEIFTPVIYGSAKAASYYRKVLNCKPLPFNFIENTEECKDGKINFVNCIKEEVKIDMGMPTEVSGEAAFRALDRAVDDLKNKIDVLAPPICGTRQSEDYIFQIIPNICGAFFKKAAGINDHGVRIFARGTCNYPYATF